ncbi:hypothetical protein [Mesorhizobium sp. WSM3224]|uniref:hypothetical protein n=1 Tax=Mesorhizobium sp. WSM3224 TaxID=1040986 RepID=UPI0003F9CC02|nr:hypothetical protein [Mesorhizobium sp. WSM3224]
MSVHSVGPVLTAEQVIVELLEKAKPGDLVSFKAAMEQAREAAPHLLETDEELTETIVTVATAFGLFVAFDSRE